MSAPDITLELPLAFGIPGGPELWVILLVVLLLFGNKLPGMARNIGRSFTEFKRGVRGGTDEDGKKSLPASEGAEQIEGSDPKKSSSEETART